LAERTCVGAQKGLPVPNGNVYISLPVLYFLRFVWNVTFTRNISNLGNAHIAEIATMALDLLAGSVIFQIPHRPGTIHKKLNKLRS